MIVVGRIIYMYALQYYFSIDCIMTLYVAMLIVDDMRLDTHAHVQGNVVVHVCKPHPLCTHTPSVKWQQLPSKIRQAMALPVAVMKR